MTTYTIEVIIALQEKERPTRAWWTKRYERAALRAGGMPPEITKEKSTLRRETDPENGERFARVSFPLPEGTGLARATELAHTLSSVLVSEGYTLRGDGKRIETLPGDHPAPPQGTFGGEAFTEGRVCSERCLTCVMASENRIGCCGEGAAFSLADIGAALLAGNDRLVETWLALPGEMDGVKWHPHLSGGKCVFHSPECGCTLPSDRMPLQCRTYLCLPDRLLSPDLLVQYEGYVDALEEAEAFVEDHMRIESGVDFGSPLEALREAAAKAFAAWEAGEQKQ